MYKPGQIITIINSKYRIYKSDNGCMDCTYFRLSCTEHPCRKCPAVIKQTRRIKLVELCGKKANK